MPGLFRRCRHLYFAWFSRPAGYRPLYRLLRRGGIHKILEVGMTDTSRTLRMVELAVASGQAITYSGVDLFEMRPATGRAGWTLKEAHRRLAASGVKSRLAPGDPFTALARTANSLGALDLIVISADLDPDSMSKAWFYVPRLLHDATRVFIEQRDEKGEPSLRPIQRAEIEQLATSGVRRRAA